MRGFERRRALCLYMPRRGGALHGSRACPSKSKLSSALNHTNTHSPLNCTLHHLHQTASSQLSPRVLISPPCTPVSALALVRSATRDCSLLSTRSKGCRARESQKVRGGDGGEDSRDTASTETIGNKRDVYLSGLSCGRWSLKGGFCLQTAHAGGRGVANSETKGGLRSPARRSLATLLLCRREKSSPRLAALRVLVCQGHATPFAACLPPRPHPHPHPTSHPLTPSSHALTLAVDPSVRANNTSSARRAAFHVSALRLGRGLAPPCRPGAGTCVDGVGIMGSCILSFPFV